MAEHDEERIRRRAYEIWLEEGRPEGRRDEHWRRAAAEITGREHRNAPAAAAEPPEPKPARRSRAKTTAEGEKKPRQTRRKPPGA